MDRVSPAGRDRPPQRDGGDASNESLLLIDSVRQKLHDRERFDDLQRGFLDHEPVRRFEESLNRFVGLVYVDDPASRQQQLRELAAALLEAIEVYEGEPTAENMGEVRHLFDELRRDHS